MFFSLHIYLYKETTYFIWLAIVNIITNIVFNYYLIGQHGGIGAAYATSLSFFIKLFLMIVKIMCMLP